MKAASASSYQDLPPPGTAQRFTPQRRLAILNAFTRGEVDLADCFERWRLSPRELAEWGREFNGQ